MLLGMKVGLDPSDIVLDGTQLPFPKKGGGYPLPNFRPISIAARRLDASKCHLLWMLASVQGLCVRWETSPLPRAEPPIFGPFLLWPNGWMDQDATWYGG